MALATFPTADEIFGTFRPNGSKLNPSDSYWTNSGLSEEPSWRATAYWRISALRTVGKVVPGLGDLRPTDQAVTELRKLLSKVQIQSLPLPAVAPVSGGAIFISWKNGGKAVEVTAYHDGEIALEGLENQNLNEEVSKKDLGSILNWLVQG